ncbi:MAG: LD-carboxypeptidase [Candidatus Kapabacteria bacterium]|nr:LD-carboxypeptidase [Candidatus Kapabacteria bacterium]
MKLSRRSFITSSVPLAAASALALHASPHTTLPLIQEHGSIGKISNQNKGKTLPPALEPGMTIGITAPASGVSKSEIQSGINFLKELGYNTVLGKCVFKSSSSGFLSAPDEQRASEFMEFVERKDIHAIMSVRGGYGVMRILPMLNYDMIAANPKIIIGYSDITALVNVIYSRCGLVTFHGPMCSSHYDDITRSSFVKTLSSNRRPASEELQPTTVEYSDPTYDVIVEGTATGILTGGNLTMICATLGTPYEPVFDNSILFLEDVNEEPYKIDRMLTQLWLSGKLANVKGVVLGVFNHCDPYQREERFRDYDMTTSLRDVFESRMSQLNIPVLSRLPIGHIRSKLTLPIGIQAELDTKKGSLVLLEPSVL